MTNSREIPEHRKRLEKRFPIAIGASIGVGILFWVSLALILFWVFRSSR